MALQRSDQAPSASAVALTTWLTSLPPHLARRIFLSLPADDKARAACVCRAWRDALADPALWTCLDLVELESASGRGDAHADELLLGAAARAGGNLLRLDVCGRNHTPWPALLAVLQANAGSLRELRVTHVDTVTHYDAVEDPGAPCVLNRTILPLLAAAPRLQLLETSATVSWNTAPRLMADPAFAAVRVRELEVFLGDDKNNASGGLDKVRPFAAALADPAQQPMLSRVTISAAVTQQPAVLDALVDALLARRTVRSLHFHACTPPAAAPLARLLADGVLTDLEFAQVTPRGAALFDAAGAAVVAEALRANTTLTRLAVGRAGLCRDTAVAKTLLGALAGHRSLRTLDISHDFSEEPEAVGIALAALVTADAPALQSVSVVHSFFGDDGLAPLVDALPCNNHLRALLLSGNGLSTAFTAERLLPAVRANASLRRLECRNEARMWPAATVAEEIVRSRGRAAEPRPAFRKSASASSIWAPA